MKSWGLFTTPLPQILTVNGKVRDALGCSVMGVLLHALHLKICFGNKMLFTLSWLIWGQKSNAARDGDHSKLIDAQWAISGEDMGSEDF